jgi:hypothetical protein
MTHDPYAPPKADSLDAESLAQPGRAQVSDVEYERIRRELKALNRTSMSVGGSGLVLQIFGGTMHGVSGLVASLMGLGLLVAGLSSYARMRGHSQWFGAFGLLGCIGVVILVLLPKKCFNCGATTRVATCGACGAPSPP